MSGRNDGGQAFPCPGLSGLPNGDVVWPEAGMTLRDYFAAKAIQGYSPGCAYSDEEIDAAVKRAYRVADAMIKASGS